MPPLCIYLKDKNMLYQRDNCNHYPNTESMEAIIRWMDKENMVNIQWNIIELQNEILSLSHGCYWRISRWVKFRSWTQTTLTCSPLNVGDKRHMYPKTTEERKPLCISVLFQM